MRRPPPGPPPGPAPGPGIADFIQPKEAGVGVEASTTPDSAGDGTGFSSGAGAGAGAGDDRDDPANPSGQGLVRAQHTTTAKA